MFVYTTENSCFVHKLPNKTVNTAIVKSNNIP